MKDKITEFYDNKIKTPDIAVSFFWKGFALFLLGVVVGFMIAPVRKGLRIGCGNGCNNGNNSPVTDNECSIEGSVDCGDADGD